MKNYYYIGEVSSLLGISAQTLRYYDKIGLVRPAHVNDQSGYRQYTYDQIHYIERIRYLQNLGLSLTDIRSALQSGQVKNLLRVLSEQKSNIQETMNKLKEIENNLEWYINYYQYLSNNHYPEIPFKMKQDKRYILAHPILPGEPIYGYAGYHLTKEKSKNEFKNVTFLRQNGYILDFYKLLESQTLPLYYFVYIKEKPNFDHPFIQEVPAGEYLCFRGNLLSDNYDATFIKKFFAEDSQKHFVIANEYEDNFLEFQNCIYEIQILI